MSLRDYDRNVFINCAFDSNFVDFFRAIVFTVHSCGFIARCALETGNRDGVRIDKIVKIIEQCRYGIHDLSSTELTEESPLPRYNMPYELGVFMGCKSFGDRIQKKKDFLVLDQIPHRYKRLISDLAGYDFPSYNNINSIIEAVRNWLAENTTKKIPGPQFHIERFLRFLEDFPVLCESMHHTPASISFKDYYALVSVWIQQETINLISEQD